MKKILAKNLKIQIPKGIETLFNVIIRNSSTIENSLMIDVKSVRELKTRLKLTNS